MHAMQCMAMEAVAMTANETASQDATLQAALSAVAHLFTTGQAGEQAVTAHHVWTKLSQGGGGWAAIIAQRASPDAQRTSRSTVVAVATPVYVPPNEHMSPGQGWQLEFRTIAEAFK
jgi:hypothetical protein